MIIESWTQWDKLFQGGRGPHHVRINPHDPERHVWVIDDGAQQVFKFTHDGKQLVMTLGELRVSGNDRTHFYRPTDVAWLPDGEFFVTDGYRGTRVVKFAADGKFPDGMGHTGSGPGSSRPSHGIVIDEQRRLYVIDRENSRIQIFDEHGRYLDEWPNLRQADDLDHRSTSILDRHRISQKILKYDFNGKLLSHGAHTGRCPAILGHPPVAVDRKGNRYVAEHSADALRSSGREPVRRTDRS